MSTKDNLKLLNNFSKHETTHACAKFWGNLRGHVESYGDLTFMDLFMFCKNLYAPSIDVKTNNML